VVKTEVQKRVKTAFWAALKKHGYMKDGTAIADDTPLVGTAQFLVSKECLKTSGLDLQRELDAVVAALIRGQRDMKRSGGSGQAGGRNGQVKVHNHGKKKRN